MNIGSEMEMINPYLISTRDNTRIHLNKEKFIIGRGPHCSHVVDDFYISKTHCIFEKINGVWYLTDQSHNGVSLNSTIMPLKIACTVSDGDNIKLPNGLSYVFVNKKNDSNNLTNLSATPSSEIQTSMRMHAYCKRNPAGEMNGPPHTNTRKRSLRNGSSNVSNNPDSRQLDMPSTSGTNNDSELTTKKRKIQNHKEDVETVNEHLQCVICTELFIHAAILGCSHRFCNYCIEAWRNRNGTCPICRAHITDITLDTTLDDEVANVFKNSNAHVQKDREEVVCTRKFREDTFTVLGRTEEDIVTTYVNMAQQDLRLTMVSSSNSSHSSTNSSHSSSNSSSNSSNSSSNSSDSNYNSSNSSYDSSSSSRSSDSFLDILGRLEDIPFIENLETLYEEDFRMFFATSGIL